MPCSIGVLAQWVFLIGLLCKWFTCYESWFDYNKVFYWKCLFFCCHNWLNYVEILHLMTPAFSLLILTGLFPFWQRSTDQSGCLCVCGIKVQACQNVCNLEVDLYNIEFCVWICRRDQQSPWHFILRFLISIWWAVPFHNNGWFECS